MDFFIERSALGHFFDVGSRGKHFLTARDDDNAHVVIVVEFLHRQRQIFYESVR